MLTYTSVVPSGIVCRALNSAKVYGFAAVPSPPSAHAIVVTPSAMTSARMVANNFFMSPTPLF